jgi:predicted DNA-binding protein
MSVFENSTEEVNKVRNRTLLRIMMAIALLIVAIPVAASAQVYQRNDDRYGYNRPDRRDVREAINRLDNSSSRLESDLTNGRSRRVLGGLFYVRNVDENAIDQVRDFRQAVRELRRSLRGDALGNSADEARLVIDRGVELDRYLRLRTGSARVDSDLAELRSNLHLLADAYGMYARY